VNEKGKVMDVQGGLDAENRQIIVWNKHGKINQQWDLVYAKDWKGETGKGEFNPQFGLYVERDFHVISGLPRGRYLDFLGRNLVIKTPSGRRSQLYYFHQ
jgi:hypothetical protein